MMVSGLTDRNKVKDTIETNFENTTRENGQTTCEMDLDHRFTRTVIITKENSKIILNTEKVKWITMDSKVLTTTENGLTTSNTVWASIA
jgi:hypothetical protein